MTSVFKPPTGSFPVLLRLLDRYHDTLEEPSKAKQACLELLVKLCGNILKDPEEPKYQRFKTSNPTIRKVILSQRGSDLILLELGFKAEVADMQEFQVFRGTIEHLQLSHDRLVQHAERMRNAVDKDASRPEILLAQQEAERLRVVRLVDEDAAKRKESLRRGRKLAPGTSTTENAEMPTRALALLALEQRTPTKEPSAKEETVPVVNGSS